MTTPASPSYPIDPAWTPLARSIMDAYYKELEELGVPFGTCFCKCLEKTKLATSTGADDRSVKGMPQRYLRHHGNRLSPVEYIELMCSEVETIKTPCWVWQRALTQGYGKIAQPGYHSPRNAHCVYYERYVGPIPKGLDLDHLCRVRACVNPAHLEPVSRAVNIRRGDNGKLIESQVREIHQKRREGLSYRAIGEIYKVSHQSCRSICIGEHWHLDDVTYPITPPTRGRGFDLPAQHCYSL